MVDPNGNDTWLDACGEEPDLRQTLRAEPVAAAPAEVPDDGLRVGDILGEGGMGVVALGDQGRLRRQVAVKRLKPDTPAEVGHTLLREAWVTGALEHPNIVPVHDLLADEQGRPQIVLKRIEGTEWEDLLAGRAPLPDDGVDDPLAWHLRVLMQVCNAIEFAHREGVVHRDLKPENVMVGAFGEVYVLDWGIAVGLRPDPKGRFPLAADQTHMVGTPVYMAPEMFQRDMSRLGPGTDVHLLGGMLFRLLAGHPPNQGEDLRAIARAAKRGPIIDPSWPADLRSLLERAFAADPPARPSAGAFRRALQRHLDRRALEQLHDHARTRLSALRELLATPSDDPAHRIAVHDAVGAVRFGLQEVLRGWPDHPTANALLQSLYREMAEHELQRGDGSSAQVWARRLDAAPEELVQRVEAVLARTEGDRRRLQRLSSDLSRRTGFVARLLMYLVLGAVWLGFPLVADVAGWQVDYLRSTLQYTMVLAVLGVGVLVFWKSIRASRTNRGLITLGMLSASFTLLALFMGWWTEVDIQRALVVKTMSDAGFVMVAALLFELILLPGALFYVAMVVVGVLLPEWSYLAGRVGTLVLVLNGLLTWPFFQGGER